MIDANDGVFADDAGCCCEAMLQQRQWACAQHASLRDRWLEELKALGVDPWSDDIPEAYRSAAWQGDVLKPGGYRGELCKAV